MTAHPVPNAPIIVTRREVERILVKESAESAIHQAAEKASDMERAQAMAMTGAILNELRRAEVEHGSPDVLVAPDHGPASRLQSLIASGEAGTLSLSQMPAGGLEAKFDTNDWAGWSTVAWAKLKSSGKYPMIRPENPGPTPLPDRARIGVLGDWGTGLYGAPKIAKTIENDRDPYALLLHLGDVYYAGSENEIQGRFLDLWPTRPEAVHRALNSNHEMYSGGVPYFTMTLRAFQQEASYFALQNQHWVLVGLDLAYVEHSIDDQQVEWLRGILNKAGSRRVVLFSHHQLFSYFESQGDKLWAHPAFADILRSGRISAWYWGHEHTCSIYEADSRTGLLGRCIGHSGMPQSRKRSRDLPPANGFGMNGGDWRQVPARMKNETRLAPPSVILEGPNPLIVGEEDDFTPHGFGVLTLDGPHLTEEVRDANGVTIYRRQLA